MRTSAEHAVVITEEGILSAIADGAKSLSAIARSFGYRAGSTSILKRITALVPDVSSHLIANRAKHEDSKIIPSPADYPIPECTPFRKSSGYSKIVAILFAHKSTGINKHDLIAKYRSWSGKSEKHALFDVQIVISSKEIGVSHKSISKAAQHYWVERRNDFLQLKLTAEENRRCKQ